MLFHTTPPYHSDSTAYSCRILLTNATEILLFLHKLVEVFTEYFKVLEEESIRDNFVVIYELLDEMMDNFGGICVSFGQCKDIEVAVADIKVLDRNTPVLVGGSTQKETLRSGL
jgi:hypothetical protein